MLGVTINFSGMTRECLHSHILVTTPFSCISDEMGYSWLTGRRQKCILCGLAWGQREELVLGPTQDPVRWIFYPLLRSRCESSQQHKRLGLKLAQAPCVGVTGLPSAAPCHLGNITPFDLLLQGCCSEKIPEDFRFETPNQSSRKGIGSCDPFENE